MEPTVENAREAGLKIGRDDDGWYWEHPRGAMHGRSEGHDSAEFAVIDAANEANGFFDKELGWLF